MKYLAHTVSALLTGMVLVVTSCAGEKTEPAKKDADSNASNSKELAAKSLKIAYVDMDSIMAKYTLAIEVQQLQEKYAKELQQAEAKLGQQLSNYQQSKGKELQNFGTKIEEKMRSNGYLSEASYKSDVQQFQQMQQSAEAQLGQMQQSGQKQLMAQMQAKQAEMGKKAKELEDSLKSYIEAYNKKQGYDAILYRSAGLHFDSSLDITKAVVDGLNARYQKKK